MCSSDLKARALTRVATPQNEASLLDLALAGTAAHVERFVRAWRRVDRLEAARETEVRHLRRELSTWVDDDGMVVIGEQPSEWHHRSRRWRAVRFRGNVQACGV